MKQQITLADVADVKVSTGPSMLKTENARPTSWIISMPAIVTWCRWFTICKKR
ncbi:hypothetical protein ACLB1E_29535 [Escherichia coli]